MNDTPAANQSQSVPDKGVPTPVSAAVPRSRGPGTMQIGIVVAILGGTVLVTALTSDVTKVSEPGIKLETSVTLTNGVSITNDVPVLVDKVGEWTGGKVDGLSQEERDILPQDTQGARRLFTDGKGHSIYCSIILAGKDVTSIHRPEMCLPGQGWLMQSEFVEPIPVPSAPGGVLNVMRMNMTHPYTAEGDRKVMVPAIFVYWFVGHDRATPYHWQRILWTSQDRLLHNRNHRWAYILIHATTPIAQSSEEQAKLDAQSMDGVRKFVADIYPALMVK